MPAREAKSDAWVCDRGRVRPCGALARGARAAGRTVGERGEERVRPPRCGSSVPMGHVPLDVSHWTCPIGTCPIFRLVVPPLRGAHCSFSATSSNREAKNISVHLRGRRPMGHVRWDMSHVDAQELVTVQKSMRANAAPRNGKDGVVWRRMRAVCRVDRIAEALCAPPWLSRAPRGLTELSHTSPVHHAIRPTRPIRVRLGSDSCRGHLAASIETTRRSRRV